MAEKTLLVGLGFLLFVHCTLAELTYIPCRIETCQDGTCKNETAQWLKKKGVWGEKIEDIHGAGLIQVLRTYGVKDISVEDSDWLTLIFDKEKQTLTVSATNWFNKNYDENGVGKKIGVNMTVTCEEEGDIFDIPYYQQIIDVNSYQPEWNEHNFNFEKTGALKKDIKLTDSIEITASDKDFTDSELTFDIITRDTEEPVKYFKIDVEKIEGKSTFLRLTTLQDIYPTFEETFVMRVKDRYGEDAKITTAKLHIKIIDTGIPFEFTKTTYTEEIIDNEFIQADWIKLDGGDEDVELSIENSPYSQYISVEMNESTGHIILDLKETLPEPPQKTDTVNKDFSLGIKAKWQNKEAFTEINIHSDKDLKLMCFIPGMDFPENIFKNPESLPDNTTADEVVFKTTGIKHIENISCNNEYLACEFDETKGEFSISTKEKFKNFEDLERDSTISMNLSIQCPYNDFKEVVFKQDVKDINNNVPQFEKDLYYFFFYNDLISSFQKPFEITKFNPIVVTEKDITSKTCKFKIEGGDDLFMLIFNEDAIHNGECRPSIAPRNMIKAPFIKKFTLVVEDDGSPSQTARTNILMVLGIGFSNKPIFSHREYFMKVVKDANNRTTLMAYEDYPTPSLLNGADSDTRFFIPDEKLAINFHPTFNHLTGVLDIMVFNPEDVEADENGVSITIPIKAVWKGLESSSKLTIGLSDAYVPPDLPVLKDDSALDLFVAYITMSLVGLMMSLVLVVLAFTVMLYIMLKRFVFPRKPLQVLPVVFAAVPITNVPEKIPT